MDAATKQALYDESWQTLVRVSVTVLLIAGQFPFYDEVKELFPPEGGATH